MPPEQVRQALGTPALTNQTGTIGAGDRNLTRWTYYRYGRTYVIDFDYTGSGGAPELYRSQRSKYNSWWPRFGRARAY